jgi:hypothetical protein
MQKVAVERISHLGKGAVEGRDNVDIFKNGCCCSKNHVQFVKYILFSPTPCTFSVL